MKFSAGEKIKIALTPFRAPGVAFASGGFHFGVGVSEMDDEFGDAGFEMVESVFVEIVPFRRRDTGVDGDDAIDDDVVWAEICLEIRKIGEPATRNKGGEIIFVSDAQNDCEEILVGLEKAILVRIEMSGLDAHGACAGDLRAKFGFDVVGIDARVGRPIVVEIAVGVDERWNFVAGSGWTPAIVDALAGKR